MKTAIIITASLLLIFNCSCKKYLEEIPDKHLTTPRTVSDLQSVLNNNDLMNAQYPASGAIASDNFYVLDNDIQAIADPLATEIYLWDKSEAPVDNLQEWQLNYQRIYFVNTILDNLEKVIPEGATPKDIQTLKGETLFFRAFTLLSMSQIYSLPFNASTSDQLLGIPLRLTSDINEPITRSTLTETYAQIIRDLKAATDLLPTTPVTLLRPAKAAAYAALANAYLITREFEAAKAAVDTALTIYNTLMDYNMLDPASNPAFAIFNPEVIWQADCSFNLILAGSYAKVDSNLYNLYDNNDIRKQIFFLDNGDGTYSFKGSYNEKWQGSSVYFCGIATDELYLIRAESLARTGHVSESLNDLNTLLEKRWKTGTFSRVQTEDQNEALRIILQERRKELCFRGALRWMDLRRLNQEQEFQQTITRIINSKSYILTPTDLHYALLIPQNVVDNSHVIQNPR